jgi:tetratricopeptide (TPR) repeat protein
LCSYFYIDFLNYYLNFQLTKVSRPCVKKSDEVELRIEKIQKHNQESKETVHMCLYLFLILSQTLPSLKLPGIQMILPKQICFWIKLFFEKSENKQYFHHLIYIKAMRLGAKTCDFKGSIELNCEILKLIDEIEQTKIEILPPLQEEEEYTIHESKVDALLALAQNYVDDEEIKIGNNYAMQAIQLLDALPKHRMKINELYFKLTNFLTSNCYYTEALKWMDILLERTKKGNKKMSREHIHYFMDRAYIMRQSGEFFEAEKIHRKILKLKKFYPIPFIEKKLLQIENIGMLALCLAFQKKFKQAKKFAQKALGMIAHQDEGISAQIAINPRIIPLTMFLPMVVNLDFKLFPTLIETWETHFCEPERSFEIKDLENIRRVRKNVNKNRWCTVCFKQSTKLKTCAACDKESEVRYCSQKCQRHDWKSHKKTCLSKKKKKSKQK